MIRNIRETSILTLIKSDWAISPPTIVIVSTSFDGKIWHLFDKQGHMQLGERILDAQRLFLTTNHFNRARYIKFDFPADHFTPGWWTVISEVSATD